MLRTKRFLSDKTRRRKQQRDGFTQYSTCRRFGATIKKTIAVAALLLLVTLVLVVVCFRQDYRISLYMDEDDVNEEEEDGFYETIELRLVSMNLALCELSASTPSSWTRHDQLDALRTELLASDPHILFLQEAPESTFSSLEDTFTLLGSRPSHKGHILLLIRNDLVGLASLVESLPNHIPAVLATLHLSSSIMRRQDSRLNDGLRLRATTSHDLSIHIASVHLHPSAQAVGKRQRQLQQLLEFAMAAAAADASSSLTPPHPQLLLLGGDTNLRESTVASRQEQQELQASGWLDAWQLAGAHAEAQYTWDTVNHLEKTSTVARNDYDRQQDYWNTYHGNGTTQMLQRYDRFYYYPYDQTPSRHPVRVKVTSFGLVADQPLAKTKTLFLSDHFGIRATLEIEL